MMRTAKTTLIHERAFASVALSKIYFHSFPHFLFCLSASSFPFTQTYLLDHSIKLVELSITGPPGDRSQPLDQWA